MPIITRPSIETLAPQLLTAALAYAKRGWRVFPCIPNQKEPRGKWKDLSTTDERKIRAHWGGRNASNIGINCGASSLLVVDFDTADTKYSAAAQTILDRLLQENEQYKIHYIVQTRKDGYHFYFHHDHTTDPIGNDDKQMPPGIDIRGNGGYVVAPPSVILEKEKTAPDGTPPPWYGGYIIYHDPAATPGKCPPWLLDIIRGQSLATTPLSGAPIVGDMVPHLIPQVMTGTNAGARGEPFPDTIDAAACLALAIEQVTQGAGRNNTGARLVGALVKRGFDKGSIVATMTAYRQRVNSIRKEHEYTADEMAATIDSIMTADNDNPLRIGAIPPPGTAETHEPPPGGTMLPLPAYATIQGDIENACPWLAQYVEYSKRESGRAWPTFHYAVGLWVLSTIAARRVRVMANKWQYPSLYFLLLARSSEWAKTTTAQIGIQTVKDAGLGFLLLPDEMTPESMIQTKSRYEVAVKMGAHATTREGLINRMLFAGQRSWFYEEFGNKLSAILNPSSRHHVYHSIIRQLDDHAESYESTTITRGGETIHNPYMAMLGNLTPADMSRAGAGSPLWGDGFWARFIFAAPPIEETPQYIPPGQGRGNIPISLCSPLLNWHNRLGVPKYDQALPEIDENDTKKGGKQRPADSVIYRKDPTIHPTTTLSIDPAAHEMAMNYDRALYELRQRLPDDIKPNYARFPAIAWRVALLFASLGDSPTITTGHWGAAQTIAELFRGDLGNAYNAINHGQSMRGEPRKATEDKVLRFIAQHSAQGVTLRDIYRTLTMDTQTATERVTALIKAGVIGTKQEPGQRAARFFVIE